MKTHKRFVSLMLLVVSGVLTSAAQSIGSDPAAYKAYLQRTTPEAMMAWSDVVAAAESTAKQNPGDDSRFKLGLAQFGLLNATMRSKDESMFNKYVDATITNLESVRGKHVSEAQAVLAAVFGLQIAYDPSKGMSMGPRSGALLSKALKDDPQSALVWKLYGNSMLHTPEAYGGDVGEAIEAYEKALSLFETTSGGIKDNWMYIDTMAFLGQAYGKKALSQKAVAIYEKALQAEPGFSWVKYSLLPAAQNGSK